MSFLNKFSVNNSRTLGTLKDILFNGDQARTTEQVSAPGSVPGASPVFRAALHARSDSWRGFARRDREMLLVLERGVQSIVET